MTISLLIAFNDSITDQYIPIAGNRAFKEEWLPFADKRQLTLIPLVLTGYPVIQVNDTTINDLILEVIALVEAAELVLDISSDSLQKMRELRDKLIWCRENWSRIQSVKFT